MRRGWTAWWMAGLVPLAALAAGCESPLIVDCAPGRFVRLGDDAWCVYERAPSRCPSTLPSLHDLPWGGAGCAAREHDPLPPELCAAVMECDDADGGAP